MLKTFLQEEGIYQSEIVFAETIKSGRIKKYKGEIKVIFSYFNCFNILLSKQKQTVQCITCMVYVPVNYMTIMAWGIEEGPF